MPDNHPVHDCFERETLLCRFYAWIHRKTGKEVNCLVSTHELMELWRRVKKCVTGLSFLRFG